MRPGPRSSPGRRRSPPARGRPRALQRRASSRSGGPDRGEAGEPTARAVPRCAQRVEQLGVGHLAGAGEVLERRRGLTGRRWQAQGGGVEGDRPALPGGEPVLERRHRGADDADVDAPVVVQRRLVAQRTPVGEVCRRRIQPGSECRRRARGPRGSRRSSPGTPRRRARDRAAGWGARRGTRRRAASVRGERADPGIEVSGAPGASRAPGGSPTWRRDRARMAARDAAERRDSRGRDGPPRLRPRPRLCRRLPRCGTPGRRGWWRRPGEPRRPNHSGQEAGERSESREQDRQRRADESHFHPVSEESGLN